MLIDRIAAAIADRVAPPVPINIALWDAETIGAYLKMSASQVLQRFAPLPSFPKAIRLPTAGGARSHPRWRAEDVIEWAESHMAKKKK